MPGNQIPYGDPCVSHKRNGASPRLADCAKKAGVFGEHLEIKIQRFVISFAGDFKLHRVKFYCLSAAHNFHGNHAVVIAQQLKNNIICCKNRRMVDLFDGVAHHQTTLCGKCVLRIKDGYSR